MTTEINSTNTAYQINNIISNIVSVCSIYIIKPTIDLIKTTAHKCQSLNILTKVKTTCSWDVKSTTTTIKTWWEKRSKLEKRLFIAAVIFCVLFIIAILLYVFLAGQSKTCTSPTCVGVAMDLLKHIDVKANPCDDFYRFACGKFQQNPEWDDKVLRSVRDIMRAEIQSRIRQILEEPVRYRDPPALNLAKNFFRNCMNESAVEAQGLFAMKDIIFKKIGGWPTLDGDDWSEKDFDWKIAVRQLRTIGINFQFFLELDIVKDQNHPNKYILKLSDPYYRPSTINAQIKNFYLDYMEDVAVMFGAHKDRARQDQQQVMELLLKLAEISERDRELNQTNLYNPMSLSELQYKFSSINWHDYLNGALAPAATVTYDDTISVSEPLYLKKLENLLYSTPKRVLANFMAWHILQHLTNFLPTHVSNRAYQYLESVNGQIIRKPRWDMCIQATKDRLGPVISAAYIQEHFNQEMRSDVMELVRNLKIELKFILKNLEWLDENTKSLTMEKLLESVEDIVSYEDMVDSVHQSQLYDNVTLLDNNLLVSALNLDFKNLNLKFSKFHKPVKDNWLESPDFVTGLDIVFSPNENTLRFPVGILGGLYYQKGRPAFMNYGALGSMVAHEIWHTSMEGESRSRKGNTQSWWTAKTLFNYEEKLQCVSRQYRSLASVDNLIHYDPTLTKDEDMADLAGLKVAYDAYKTYTYEHGEEYRLPGLSYTPNQLFWISSAVHHCAKFATNLIEKKQFSDIYHSPEKLRVNGALINLKEFAYDFGCSSNDRMIAKEKCSIFK